uniref:Uncharacterized protein n=1 Tax=Arion vulgaris TaxID=1028688 RepID=A0A0B7B4C3_9EUPU
MLKIQEIATRKGITIEKAVELVLNDSKDEFDLYCDYFVKDIEMEFDNHLDNEELLEKIDVQAIYVQYENKLWYLGV